MVAVSIVLVLVGVSAAGQQAQTRFDVTSVRESRDQPPAAPSETPNGVSYQSVPLIWLISRAFDIKQREILGGPDWIRARRFDLNARTETEVKSRAEFRPMLQALLEDRFGLKVERIQEERPVYALVVARSDRRLGSGLEPSTSHCSRDLSTPTLESTKRADGRQVARSTQCGARIVSAGGGQILAVFGSRVSMTELASALSSSLDRPVIDRTGLTGEFDFVVQASVVLSASPDPARDALGGDWKLFVAIEDQLGLKLQPSRAPVDVLAIGSVQSPTEN
jgi:uncharacterized protein (TIGR03435 family)